ncbi:exodeoxyribonuclease V subunit alpha [Testudinibacter sp. P27/CKL/0425]
MITLLQQLKQAEAISPLDYQFARFIDRKQQPFDYPQTVADLAVLLAALSSYHSQSGSTCIKPHDFEAGDFFDLAMQTELRPLLQQVRERLQTIAPAQWQTALAVHIAFSDQAQQPTPLFWANGLLYLYRNFSDERQIAEQLLLRLQQQPPQLAPSKLAEFLSQLFEPQTDGEIDWQKVAVATSVRHSFSLISGRPGTGKTRTVSNLLLTLQWQQQQMQQPPLKIALAAPTGKAAARLSESINQALQQLPSAVSAELRAQIPQQAQTLHRLLGSNPKSQRLRYHQGNPLPFDLLVVDEASMVDLNLFAQLLNALSPQTRLVLLGDKDQLTSVEAGAVMAELCRFLAEGYSLEHCAYLQQTTAQSLAENWGKAQGNPIRDCLSFLQKSYRFRADSGIKALSQAVNQGKAESWHDFERFADLNLYPYPQLSQPNAELLDSETLARNRTLASVNLILQHAVAWYGEYLQLMAQLDEFELPKIAAIFRAFNQVRLLTGLRKGEFGVEQLNLAVSERLRQTGQLSFHLAHEWYHGKPIMVLQNDNAAELYNGDIGLFLTDKHGNSKVWFENGEGQYRAVSPHRVPSHEAAFVMTVHKSQGSEFAHTALILPLTMNPILSSELIYTAITRAKVRFSLFGNARIWQSAVQQPIRRRSGLYLALGEAETN